jgi:L-fucose isomerase-like protein
MITGDLYFTFIKIPSNYKCLLVCKSWHKNIIGDIKKRKIEFYDMQLYNAINNKHIFLLYRAYDKVLLQAYDNVIINIMKIIIKDADIRDKIMEKFIENYKQLSIIISIFHNYNTTAIVANAVNAANAANAVNAANAANAVNAANAANAATIATQNIKYTSDDDNIEKYIADEYANILSKYYNYNIILT